MKVTRIVINILLIIGLLLSTYFLYMSLTPEGYTGIFIVFKYDVHSPVNPIIYGVLFLIALIAFNWKALCGSKNTLKVIGMFVIAAILLGGVFFFLNVKRHNRFPWEHPNVVLIVVDTLRADHISAYNTAYAKTPHMDGVAQDGWIFEQAYSHIPITMPSHSSLFTSKLPSEIGVMNNADSFESDATTLAEVLQANGYQTAAMISLGVLRAKFNLSRGFDHYDDRLPSEQGQWFNRANVITDRGIKWLEENQTDEQPFFLWLHYQDPHAPYDPPGSPADTAVAVNGTVITEGILESAAFIRATFELKPGWNEVEIQKLSPSTQRHIFSSIYFTGIEDGPYPSEWQKFTKTARDQGKGRLIQESRRLQESRFLSSFNGLTIAGLRFFEGTGWVPPENTAKPKRRINSGAVIRVNNTTGETRTVTLHLKGEVSKTTEEVRKSYASEVEYADREIGRFIDYLKKKDLYNNTIIVLMSDHGEELNEHGKVGHIHDLYTQSLHVPLIIRDPDTSQKGKRVSRLARLIDVSPTILDMTGIRKPDSMTGKTLLEYILRNRSPERPLYCQTFAPEAEETRFGINELNKLSIYNPSAEPVRRYELYNLLEDEYQWKNLSLHPSAPGVNEAARRTRDYAESMEYVEVVRTIETERAEMLRDLGYLSSGKVSEGLDDLGIPTEAMVNSVYDAMMAGVFGGISDITSSAENLAGDDSGERLYYIHLQMQIPENFGVNDVLAIQDHVILTVMAQARQFPLRLTLRKGETVVMDRGFPGNNTNIKNLYGARMMRLLMLQPFNTALSAAYEQLFPQVSSTLEAAVGIKE